MADTLRYFLADSSLRRERILAFRYAAFRSRFRPECPSKHYLGVLSAVEFPGFSVRWDKRPETLLESLVHDHPDGVRSSSCQVGMLRLSYLVPELRDTALRAECIKAIADRIEYDIYESDTSECPYSPENIMQDMAFHFDPWLSRHDPESFSDWLRDRDLYPRLLTGDLTQAVTESVSRGNWKRRIIFPPLDE